MARGRNDSLQPSLIIIGREEGVPQNRSLWLACSIVTAGMVLLGGCPGCPGWPCALSRKGS